jgi:hypothetical protein
MARRLQKKYTCEGHCIRPAQKEQAHREYGPKANLLSNRRRLEAASFLSPLASTEYQASSDVITGGEFTRQVRINAGIENMSNQIAAVVHL